MNDTPRADARVTALLTELGVPAGYGTAPVRPAFPETTDLLPAGDNLLGRPQQLTPAALGAWQAMQESAAADDVTLLLISGFRSIDYQADLVRKKLATGQSIDDILRVVAAPGFSEHHTGRAVDIATPGSRPLTEDFEQTAAFSWLTEKAETYDFSMSYPRDNAEGFVFEPWHWCYQREG